MGECGSRFYSCLFFVSWPASLADSSRYFNVQFSIDIADLTSAFFADDFYSQMVLMACIASQL